MLDDLQELSRSYQQENREAMNQGYNGKMARSLGLSEHSTILQTFPMRGPRLTARPKATNPMIKEATQVRTLTLCLVDSRGTQCPAGVNIPHLRQRTQDQCIPRDQVMDQDLAIPKILLTEMSLVLVRMIHIVLTMILMKNLPVLRFLPKGLERCQEVNYEKEK